MIITYHIDAVHPIYKRVIRTGLSKNEKTSLLNELIENNYESIEVKEYKTYQKDDVIHIDKKRFDSFSDITKETIQYIFGESPEFPLTGKLKELRLDNQHGQMIIKWNNAISSMWEQTNTYFLEKEGFKFELVKLPYIPVNVADDEILSADDLVLKYLMKNNNLNEKQARQYLAPVYKAMKKAECIFYRP